MEPTVYGTSSLAVDERLASQMNNKRRAFVKWGVFGVATCGICSTLALLGTSPVHEDAIAEAMRLTTSAFKNAAPAVDAEVTCFQSSYIDNVTQMMEPVTGLKWKRGGQKSAQSYIVIDLETKFQEIMGFGGAFTEAAALQFQKLPPKKQEEILNSILTRRKAAHTNLAAFDDVLNDTKLLHFDMSVKRDQQVLIPFIKRALSYTPSLLGSMDPVGLKDDMRAAWALYFSKFITAYKKQGIPFWGLTPQNEPEFAAPWEACKYNASYQAEFIGDFLGPVLDRDHPEVTLMVFDHNRASVRHWAEAIYNHPTAGQYVDGMAFHWYDMERYMDGVAYHERLNDTHFIDQNRFMLATESCNCPGVAYGDAAWFRAQRYGHDIMTDLNNHVVGWVDWNLLLNHKGGPNHQGNNCDAPIILTEDGTDFHIQPMFYFIQHFSKYIPVGSRRVKTHVAARFEKPGDAQLMWAYPTALASCDGSARQTMHVTNDNKIEVTGSGFCLGMVDAVWQGKEIQMEQCKFTQQSWTFEEETGRIRVDDFCLSLNHASSANGVRLTASRCEAEIVPHQQWTFNEEDGTLRSRASTTDQCATGGYSFDRKVLVVMNENTEAADFEIQVGDMALETSIPKGAIRTFTWM
ncbi:Glycoside hydrolase superfamily [Phytophthora cactorum]|nr:Glycoside hydrolase superfamily [Phytophthora cactorum]